MRFCFVVKPTKIKHWHYEAILKEKFERIMNRAAKGKKFVKAAGIERRNCGEDG